MIMEPTPSKAANRVSLNRSLLAIVIGIFFLTLNLKQELLSQKILALQLILAIPLFTISMLAYSKVGYRKEIKGWNILGWVTFTFGYAFLFNVIGILVGEFIGVTLALAFFATSWILMLIYSFVDINYNKSVIKERIIKDSLFILIQLLLGVFVVIGLI